MKSEILDHGITLHELFFQKKLSSVIGEEITLDMLNNLILSGSITAYDKKDCITKKEKKFIVEKRQPEKLGDMIASLDGDSIIFNIYDILKSTIQTVVSKNEATNKEKIVSNDNSNNINSNKNEKIENLECEIAELKKEISANKNIQKTIPATITRLSNVAQSWKDAINVIVLVAMECQKEGPSKRKRNELKNLCKRYGGKLSNAQLDALRQALPEDHVDRENRADYLEIP